jgi:Ion channel regulatory protein UNC-93
MERYIPIRSIPTWVKTPRAQTIELGFVFLLLFAAYTTIQFYAASTYGATLAADSVSALYASFALSCFVSPTLVHRWGSRPSMAVGILGGYAAFVVLSMFYFQGFVGRYTVIVGGILLGFGAALLWTAQGELILQYAQVADHTSMRRQQSQPEPRKPESGRLLGTFWAVFQCSSLVGGVISFLYYFNDKADEPTGSFQLYGIFLSLMVLSAVLSQLLLPPSSLSPPCTSIPSAAEVVESHPTDAIVACEESPLLRVDPPLEQQPLRATSWMEEAKDTYGLFANNHSIQILALIFFYTGFNQPYQQATFTRFLSKRSIGLELIVFHSMEIAGAIITGHILDRTPHAARGIQSQDHPRLVAKQCLVLFIVVNASGNLIALLEERDASNTAHREANALQSLIDVAGPFPNILIPSLAFACWGWADAQIQVCRHCHWCVIVVVPLLSPLILSPLLPSVLLLLVDGPIVLFCRLFSRSCILQVPSVPWLYPWFLFDPNRPTERRASTRPIFNDLPVRDGTSFNCTPSTETLVRSFYCATTLLLFQRI